MGVDQHRHDRFARARDRANQFRSRYIIRYQHPDFPRMIRDLAKLGFRYDVLAFLLDVSPACINGIKNGARTSFMTGDLLIKFWIEQTNLQRYPLIGEELSYRYELSVGV